jgi:hypothetical protein
MMFLSQTGTDTAAPILANPCRCTALLPAAKACIAVLPHLHSSCLRPSCAVRSTGGGGQSGTAFALALTRQVLGALARTFLALPGPSAASLPPCSSSRAPANTGRAPVQLTHRPYALLHMLFVQGAKTEEARTMTYN